MKTKRQDPVNYERSHRVIQTLNSGSHLSYDTSGKY